MEQLVKAMLSVGAGLSKINNSSLIAQWLSFQINSFSVALHIELLHMWNKLAECLAIGKDGP